MYKLIENILPDSILVEIKNELHKLEYRLCDQSIPIHISSLTTDTSIQEYPVYMFNFYNYNTPAPETTIGGNIYNALKYFMPNEFDGYNLMSFQAVRVLKQPQYPINKHSIPHCDWSDTTCKTILFYLDDSDGNTIFFNEPICKNFYDDINTRKFTIFQQNTPKRNSALVFDSNLLHAARPPIKYESRSILNIILQKI